MQIEAEGRADWLASLEQPRSLTMHGYLYHIPLHRVGGEEAARRKHAETERLAAALGKDRQKTDHGASWVDATIHRLAKAAEAGLLTEAADILSPNGFATGDKRRRLIGPVESARRLGWINERHYVAGTKFFETMNAAIKHPRVIAVLDGVVVDGGRTSGNLSDYRAKAQSSLKRALLALPQKYRDPFFSWAFRSLGEDISVMILGAYFSRAANPRDVNEVGKRKLKLILNGLAKHYGL